MRRIAADAGVQHRAVDLQIRDVCLQRAGGGRVEADDELVVRVGGTGFVLHAETEVQRQLGGDAQIVLHERRRSSFT